MSIPELADKNTRAGSYHLTISRPGSITGNQAARQRPELISSFNIACILSLCLHQARLLLLSWWSLSLTKCLDGSFLMKWDNMIPTVSAGIFTPMLYSNESEISQDPGSNESQTVIKQKTFLQAVQKKSNLQSNKKLSPLSFNQREDNKFLFNFLFILFNLSTTFPFGCLRNTMTIHSSQFLWFSLFCY